MTLNEEVKILRGMVGKEDDSDTCAAYLALAAEKILARLYPFDNTRTDIPQRYGPLKIEIAAYLMNKRGAEGQTSHSENGISRSYESGDVPESMLRSVVPFCGVVK